MNNSTATQTNDQYSLGKILGIWLLATVPVCASQHALSMHMDGDHYSLRAKRVFLVPDLGPGAGIGVEVQITNGHY